MFFPETQIGDEIDPAEPPMHCGTIMTPLHVADGWEFHCAEHSCRASLDTDEYGIVLNLRAAP